MRAASRKKTWIWRARLRSWTFDSDGHQRLQYGGPKEEKRNAQQATWRRQTSPVEPAARGGDRPGEAVYGDHPDNRGNDDSTAPPRRGADDGEQLRLPGPRGVL